MLATHLVKVVRNRDATERRGQILYIAKVQQLASSASKLLKSVSRRKSDETHV